MVYASVSFLRAKIYLVHIYHLRFLYMEGLQKVLFLTHWGKFPEKNFCFKWTARALPQESWGQSWNSGTLRPLATQEQDRGRIPGLQPWKSTQQTAALKFWPLSLAQPGWETRSFRCDLLRCDPSSCCLRTKGNYASFVKGILSGTKVLVHQKLAWSLACFVK